MALKGRPLPTLRISEGTLQNWSEFDSGKNAGIFLDLQTNSFEIFWFLDFLGYIQSHPFNDSVL